MTTWAQFRTDLKTAIAALVPGHQVVWRDQSKPFAKPGFCLVSMHLQTVKGNSLTEIRLGANVADPDTVDENTFGWRQSFVSCKVETHQQTDVGVAINTAERIVSRLKSFNDQSSLCQVFDTNTVEDYADDRAQSVVVFDMSWNVLITDVRTQGIGTFSQIEVTSHVSDGVAELPVPPNYTELIPPDVANFLVLGPDQLTTSGSPLTV